MAAEKIEESATGRGVKKKAMVENMRRGQMSCRATLYVRPQQDATETVRYQNSKIRSK